VSENEGGQVPPGHPEGAAREFVLPHKLPDEWLKQLSGTTPSWRTTLLGSAVVAGVIAWASSYFTARMTISANLDLERAKLSLQMQQEQARVKSAAYMKLAEAISDLHTTFASYLIFVAIAGANKTDKAESASVSRELTEVVKSERGVATANYSLYLAPTT